MDKYHSDTTPSSDGTLRAEKDLVYRPLCGKGSYGCASLREPPMTRWLRRSWAPVQGKNKYLHCLTGRHYHQRAGLGQDWARSRIFLFCWRVTNYLFLLHHQNPKNLECLVEKVEWEGSFQIQVYPYILYKPESSLLTVSGMKGKRFVIKSLKFTS